jgi:hypothetical protein
MAAHEVAVRACSFRDAGDDAFDLRISEQFSPMLDLLIEKLL